eukprot:1137847-Pelagomonas_calceolata.AAC.7
MQTSFEIKILFTLSGHPEMEWFEARLAQQCAGKWMTMTMMMMMMMMIGRWTERASPRFGTRMCAPLGTPEHKQCLTSWRECKIKSATHTTPSYVALYCGVTHRADKKNKSSLLRHHHIRSREHLTATFRSSHRKAQETPWC